MPPEAVSTCGIKLAAIPVNHFIDRQIARSAHGSERYLIRCAFNPREVPALGGASRLGWVGEWRSLTLLWQNFAIDWRNWIERSRCRGVRGEVA
jgi:hypothetical protein